MGLASLHLGLCCWQCRHEEYGVSVVGNTLSVQPCLAPISVTGCSERQSW